MTAARNPMRRDMLFPLVGKSVGRMRSDHSCVKVRRLVPDAGQRETVHR